MVSEQGLDVRVGGEVEGAEGHVPERSGHARAVDVGQPQVPEHAGGALWVEGGVGTSPLETNLDNFQGICENNIGQTRAGTVHHLLLEGNVTVVGLEDLVPDKVIHSELDGLLRDDSEEVHGDSPVQTGNSHIPQGLGDTIFLNANLQMESYIENGDDFCLGYTDENSLLEKFSEYREYIDDESEVEDYASYLGVSGQAFETVVSLF